MSTTDQQRVAINSLFSFVEEVTSLRQAVTKNLTQASWMLDLEELNHALPGLKVGDPSSSDPDLICRIEKLDLLPCPPLPESLLDYVEGTWRDPNWEETWLPFPGEVKAALEAEDPEATRPVDALNDSIRDAQKALCATLNAVREEWRLERQAWLEARAPILANNRLFDRFQTMRDLVLESNLRYECVLGNYRFISDSTKTQNPNAAHYPLLVQPLSVELTSSRRNLPTLEIRRNPDEAVRFLTEVLKPFADDGIQLDATQTVDAYLEEEGHDVPLIGNATLEHHLQTMAVRLHPSARWREADAAPEAPDSDVKFRVVPRPLLLVQLRPSGVREAIRSIREEIARTGDVPEHLKEIVCPDVYPTSAPDIDPTPTLEAKLAATAGEDDEILLTKPANSEQLAIAREIERNNVVLVQGPPGTGKTHTIANLLGHFLAQGKRVLVTSHTAKALTVLKDKLPREIQPLCVTMIGDRKDLERTTSALTTRLNTMNTTDLEARIQVLTDNRQRLNEALRDRRQRIYAQRLRERETIAYQGESLSLTEIASILRDEEAFSSLIPGEVLAGPLPLTPDELVTLYRTNGRWPADISHDLVEPLPDPAQLPDADTMREMYARHLATQETQSSIALGFRREASGDRYLVFTSNGCECLTCPEAKRDLLTQSLDSSVLGTLDDPMCRLAFNMGLTDPSYVDAFTQLEDQLTKTAEMGIEVDRLAMIDNVTVTLPDNADLEAIIRAAEWFKQNDPKGRVGFFGRLFNREAREADTAIAPVTVNGRRPDTTEAFDQLLRVARYHLARHETQEAWNRLAERAHVALFETYGANPAKTLIDRYGTTLSSAAQWWHQTFLPFISSWLEAGIRAEPIEHLAKDWMRDADPANAAHRLIKEIVTPVHSHVYIQTEREQLQAWRQDVKDQLNRDCSHAYIVEQLSNAILTNPEAWAKGLESLKTYRQEREVYRQRQVLLEKLQAMAPDWAMALRVGLEGFTDTIPSSDLDEAWRWKQLERLYSHYTAVEVEELQADCTRLSADLRECTAQLAATKAWYEVKKRLQGTPALSHLSYLATYMKRAAGKSKKHAIWRREVNRLLPECQRAVPVWIMMLQDALLNFNSAAKFDIVIIDEASQADMTALPILYMGQKVIVVGDDKQVTPLAIGTNDTAVDSLARQYLEGRVKEPKLYDSRLSIYGLVQSMAFPAHMLVEHFRCVPEIIGYSNRLSYNGSIRPLRDTSTSKLKPALIPWRTNGTYTDGKTNEEEAQTIIRLLKAMMADPRYDGKTFGVIAMRSGRSTQINRIHQLLIENFDPREIEARELTCGSSADFQGDERDVILLSLVDSATPGVILRKEGEGTEGSARKRWNVAVSRARDQLWIVHSFDANTQLKHDDLRRTLFDWAAEVEHGEPDTEAIREAADSEFEVRVAEELIRRGYHIEQQHHVGSYRLDMVVRYAGEAVALECDGERYHGEDQIRNDMERQTVLERNGWRFIRLRGAEYFRRPDAAIDRVCHDLAELGIYPETRAPMNTNDLLARIRENMSRLENDLPLLEPHEPLPTLESDANQSVATEGTHFTLVEDHALTDEQFISTDSTSPAPEEQNVVVHAEAALVPLEVKHSDITLTPELRDPVKVSLPTLTDLLGDESQETETDAKATTVITDKHVDIKSSTDLRIEVEPAVEETTVVETPTYSTQSRVGYLIEEISEACVARKLTPTVTRLDDRISIEVKGHTLLLALLADNVWRIEMPSVEGIRARGVANYTLVREGSWKAWDLTDVDFANDKFVKDFASFAGRTAEGLRA